MKDTITISDIKLSEIPKALFEAMSLIRVDEETGEVIGAEYKAEVTAKAEEKIAFTAMYIRERRAYLKARKIVADSINASIASEEKRLEWLNRQMVFGMKEMGVKAIEHPSVVVKFRNNPPTLDTYEETLVPEKYWIQPPMPEKRIDRKALLADLKNGEEVQGARLVTKESLIIR